MGKTETDRDKKFINSKEGQIFNLKWEISDYESSRESWDKISHVCSAAWIMAKGTRFEEGVKEIIKSACPEFFED